MTEPSPTTVTIHCQACPASETHQITTQFAGTRWGVDHEHGWCPDHAAAADFLDAVCPGCVSGFGECGLSDAFMYADRRRRAMLTDERRATIAAGRCPFRTNGTFTIRAGGPVEPLDLSNRATNGRAMLAVIDDYVRRYPTRTD